MKVSELIEQLQAFQVEHGDKELYVESGDGRSTWQAALSHICIEYRKEWYDKILRWRIKLSGTY